METKKITVCGKKFDCKNNFGTEYLEKSDNKESSGFPFEPYKLEKIIDDEHAYLVDAEKIVWTLERPYGEEFLFTRWCLRSCMTYIMQNDDDFKGLDYLQALTKIGIRSYT